MNSPARATQRDRARNGAAVALLLFLAVARWFDFCFHVSDGSDRGLLLFLSPIVAVLGALLAVAL